MKLLDEIIELLADEKVSITIFKQAKRQRAKDILEDPVGRIRNHAAMGVWKRPWQCCCHL